MAWNSGEYYEISDATEASATPEVDLPASEGQDHAGENYDDCVVSEEMETTAEATETAPETANLPDYDDCALKNGRGSNWNPAEGTDLPSEDSYDDCAKLDEKNIEHEPFDENGNLKANIEYQTGEYDYRYTTDDQGRISSFQTDELCLTERDDRLPHDAGTFGKEETDDAGHLIGDRFGGSPHLDNIVSQDAHINRGEYKIMENEWSTAIENGKSVEVAGDVSYEGDSKRPSSFDVFYSVDGEVYGKSFINRRN
jgi:hypothetical protein